MVSGWIMRLGACVWSKASLTTWTSWWAESSLCEECHFFLVRWRYMGHNMALYEPLWDQAVDWESIPPSGGFGVGCSLLLGCNMNLNLCYTLQHIKNEFDSQSYVRRCDWLNVTMYQMSTAPKSLRRRHGCCQPNITFRSAGNIVLHLV